MHSSPLRQSGFTLTEIAATLAVASVSLSLVVPSLQQISASNAQASAINQLVTDLHRARGEALTGNVSVALCPSRSGTACDGRHWTAGWIRFVDTDHDGLLGAADRLLGTSAPLAAGVDLRTQAFASGMVFGPRGSLAAGGSFWVCADAGGADQLLHLTPTGHPHLGAMPSDTRVCDPG